MSKIPVCLPNNQIVHTEGEIIHIWTVAPVLDKQLRPAKHAFAVRSLKTGMRIALFKESQIAHNFAGWLWRNYGDITQTLVNSFNNAETPADTALLDEIDERSNHPTRIKRATHAKQYPGLFSQHEA